MYGVTDEHTARHLSPVERARYALGVGLMAVAAVCQLVWWIARLEGRGAATWTFAAVMVVGFAVAHAGLVGRRATTVLLASSAVLVALFASAAAAGWR